MSTTDWFDDGTGIGTDTGAVGIPALPGDTKVFTGVAWTEVETSGICICGCCGLLAIINFLYHGAGGPTKDEPPLVHLLA